jgi:hypothetical protein
MIKDFDYKKIQEDKSLRIRVLFLPRFKSVWKWK